MTPRRHASGSAGPSRPIGRHEIPKALGGTRQLVMLDPADESAFSRTVARALPSLGSATGSGSHAHRPVGWDPRGAPVLEPWTRARRRWRREVARLAGEAALVAVTDVRECYGSILPSAVDHRLRALGTSPADADVIGSWLRAFRDAGVGGLPIGPTGSALLAEVVLSAGDDAIRSTGAPFVRWVDDVVIFAPDRRTRADALRALRRTWATFGLEPHEGKTVQLDDPGELAARLGTTSNVPASASALR